MIPAPAGMTLSNGSSLMKKGLLECMTAELAVMSSPACVAIEHPGFGGVTLAKQVKVTRRESTLLMRGDGAGLAKQVVFGSDGAQTVCLHICAIGLVMTDPRCFQRVCLQRL